MAALHARCFTLPRPWSAGEFTDLLAQPGVFALTRPQGLLLGRVILDEAELLTLAVAPEVRGQGIGADLTQGFLDEARARGAVSAFLEVAANNAPAQRLYDRLGWQQVGRRPRYFSPVLDALLLGITL